jgi:hydroxyethylthiazole kinase-like sugar kinase family protein
MPFNSESAREAGQRSRRGKAKVSSEIRDKLSNLTDSLIESIDITTLSISDRIALLRILVGYTVPKIASEKQVVEKEEMSFQVEIIDKLEQL